MNKTFALFCLAASLTACVGAPSKPLAIKATAAAFPATKTEDALPTSPPDIEPTAEAVVDGSLLYISGTTHIESIPINWPDPEALLSFLEQVTVLGMRWSVGADVGWLEGEPRAAEIIQRSEAMGVQWDIHTHSVDDRAKAAYLIQSLGGHPDTVISGMQADELLAMWNPQTYGPYTWTAQVVWGGALCPGHRPGCDIKSVGVWQPSAADYNSHDPNGLLINVGGGTHQLADGLALAQEIANGVYDYPLVSFTVMVDPGMLTVVQSADGIEAITRFVGQMSNYDFVRWATIEETAQAWLAAGSVASRIEME